MARNPSGTYTLAAGNPVVANTTILSADFNNTMNDIATALTDSLSRTGQGGMLAPMLFSNGTVTAPGIAWSAETNTGFFRAAAGDIQYSLQGVPALRFYQAKTFIYTPTATWAQASYEGIQHLNSWTGNSAGTIGVSVFEGSGIAVLNGSTFAAQGTTAAPISVRGTTANLVATTGQGLLQGVTAVVSATGGAATVQGTTVAVTTLSGAMTITSASSMTLDSVGNLQLRTPGSANNAILLSSTNNQFRGPTNLLALQCVSTGLSMFNTAGQDRFAIGTNMNFPNIPNGTLAAPPTVNIGDVWSDTTTSATHPMLRIRRA